MLRSFPSGHRQKAALVAAGLLVLSPVIAPFAFASDPDPDDLRDKQREVKKDIGDAHDDLDESSATLRKATIKLREARGELTDARTKLTETRADLAVAKRRDTQMQRKLTKAVAALETARERLEDGRDDVKDQRDEIGDTTAELYQMGDPELSAFVKLLDAESPDQLIRMDSVNEAIADENVTDLSDLETTEILLKVREKNVEKQKDAVEKQRKAAADNLALRNRLTDEAEDGARDVRRLVTQFGSAKTDAERARKQDAAALREIKAEQQKLESKLREIARKNAQKEARKEAQKNAQKDDGNQADSATQSSGGFLSYPVSGGYVTSPYGMRTHPIYGYRSLHDGVDFGGGCGTELYAAADGTVISYGFQTVYGNRLVIDNGYARGSSVATIYNHASSYVVNVGDRVKRGQLIGYEGTTGWSTGCHLHFTVMVNGVATDPMNWL